MTRIRAALLLAVMVAPAVAAAQVDAADDRSTAFVAAEAPAEAFGQAEGKVLFGSACAVVCAGIAFLLAGSRASRRCRERLDAAFSRLGGDDHA
jgi:hypothetical protein